MIKAEELMIGNYVEYAKNIHIVTEIRKDRACSIWINPVHKDTVYECGFDELTPIPITEKILENLGFERSAWDNFKTMRLMIGNNDYTIVYENGIIEIGDIINNELRYVHQLQNLYFALTQKHLTLK